jgi:glucose-6-phosphate-specific signal transduction histidine kinase
MKQSRGQLAFMKYRALLAVGIVLGYLCVFPILRSTLGPGATSLIVLPVVVVAWYYGFRGGLGAAVLLVTLTVPVLMLIEGFSWQYLAQRGIPGGGFSSSSAV